MTLDPAIVATILAAGGIGVTGITEMLKRLLKWEDFKAYLISAVVSVGVTLFVMWQGQVAITLFPVIGYSLLVFLEANGIYKVVKK